LKDCVFGLELAQGGGGPLHGCRKEKPAPVHLTSLGVKAAKVNAVQKRARIITTARVFARRVMVQPQVIRSHPGSLLRDNDPC
jgi:hypothetical protein